MPLIPCPDCGHALSPLAAACVSCGRPTDRGTADSTAAEAPGDWTVHGAQRRFGPFDEEDLVAFFNSGMVTSQDRITGPRVVGEVPAAEVAKLLGVRAPSPAARPVVETAFRAQYVPASSGIGTMLRVAVLLAMLGGVAWAWIALKDAELLSGDDAPLSARTPGVATPRPNGGGDWPAPLDATPAAMVAVQAPQPAGRRDWFGIGKALETNRDWNGLLLHATQWIADEPESFGGWALQGIALDHLGRDQEALVATDRAIALDGGKSFLWHNRASVLTKLGRDAEAEVAARRAIELDGNNADAWNALGVSLNRRGMLPEALAAYDRCVRLDPAMHLCWLNLGDAYYGLKRYSEADNAYRQISPASPSGERARVGLQNVDAMRRVQVGTYSVPGNAPATR